VHVYFFTSEWRHLNFSKEFSDVLLLEMAPSKGDSPVVGPKNSGVHYSSIDMLLYPSFSTARVTFFSKDRWTQLVQRASVS